MGTHYVPEQDNKVMQMVCCEPSSNVKAVMRHETVSLWIVYVNMFSLNLSILSRFRRKACAYLTLSSPFSR